MDKQLPVAVPHTELTKDMVTGHNGHKPKRPQQKRSQTETATNRNGHKQKWPQTEMATNQKGHRPKQPQTETATNRNGHSQKHHIAMFLPIRILQ